MELKLTEHEVTALKQLLDGSLRELKGEIHDTDNVAYRKELTDYQTTLQGICARLDG